MIAAEMLWGAETRNADHNACRPIELSFAKVHMLLASRLTELFVAWMTRPTRKRRLVELLAEAADAKLPRRRKIRQNEPRAQHHEPQIFPRIRGSREEARDALKNLS